MLSKPSFQVLHLLITENLNKLGGNATKVLFLILEELAFHGSYYKPQGFLLKLS